MALSTTADPGPFYWVPDQKQQQPSRLSSNDDECMLEQLCSNPRSWDPILKRVPVILNRLKKGPEASYITGAWKSVAEYGDDEDLQVIGIFALLFVREVAHAIYPQCHKATFVMGLPYLFSRVMLYSRMGGPIPGFNGRLISEWVKTTLNVIKSRDYKTMLLEGVNRDYVEMLARKDVFDMGTFNGLEGDFPTVTQLRSISTAKNPHWASEFLDFSKTVETSTIEGLREIARIMHRPNMHLDLVDWISNPENHRDLLVYGGIAPQEFTHGIKTGFFSYSGEYSGKNGPISSPETILTQEEDVDDGQYYYDDEGELDPLLLPLESSSSVPVAAATATTVAVVEITDLSLVHMELRGLIRQLFERYYIKKEKGYHH